MKRGFWSELIDKLKVQTPASDAELVARYAAIVESSDDAIISKDLSGIINGWNPAAERLFGYRAKEAVGQSVLLLIPEALRNEEAHILEQIRQGRKVRHFETQRRCKDGRLIDVSLAVSPVRDAQGRIVGASKIVRDISEHKAIEVARQVEARLRQELMKVTEMVPGVVYSYRLRPDGSSHCPYISSHVEELFGVTPAKAAENALFMIDRIHPDDRDKTLASVAASARDMSVWQTEFRILHPQRGLVWIEAMAAPTAESGGNIIWHGFLHDVTQRKQTEQALQLSEFTLESASEAVYWIRPDSSFHYCNAAASRMLGYDREQLLGMSVIDLDVDFQEARWREHFAELKQQGSALLETTHRARDGQVIPVEVSAHCIQFEGQEYNCAIVRDISERLEANKELRLMRLSVQQATDGIYWLREDGGIEYVNDTACRSLGYSRDELLAMTVFDIDPAYPRAEWARHWRESDSSESGRLESWHRRRDGSQFPVEVTGTYLELGEQTLKCAVVRDISERKASQAQLQQRMHLLESAQAAAQLGYYVTDLERGRWLGSPMLHDIMGIDESYDHTVENWGLLVHPDERQQAFGEYLHAVQNQELLHHEYRIVRPRDGDIIWVDARGMFEYE